MMKLNREFFLDRVHACWTGKNIGGTMGTPYEGRTEMQNISGFASAKGEPLPNDDLDLQLVWLCAVEERGIRSITPQLLGEYWLDYIPPHWNEYGVGKGNMKLGLLPPFSGEFNNNKWKTSNGAWIRTEIWACLFPGFPDLAVKYAYNDACVDHGLSEGTYAAMFVAAMESAAFFENDIRKLIDLGLSYIPAYCLLAKSIKLATELYDRKTDFVEARNAIVEASAELGWFQAPANVSFVILGLLYGEGDFKKSMIYAINCGDDTDCTGATIGALMGIMNGTGFIPEDWAEYIGDKIVSVAIDRSYLYFPRDCTELTQRVYELVPSTVKAYELYLEYTDGETERDIIPDSQRVWKRLFDFEIPRTGLSFNLPDMIYAKGRVEFDRDRISAGETVKLTFVITDVMSEHKEIFIDLTLPEGWSADRKSLSLAIYGDTKEVSVNITAGEEVKPINKIYAELTTPGRLTDVVAPIIIHG